MKKTFYSEMAYVVGIIALALGTSFMERADFGVSMVVAPAYLVYLKISAVWSWFTFGMAEYTLQALVLVILAVVLGGFKLKFLFSFITAFLYGNVLDLTMKIVGVVESGAYGVRITYYMIGLFCCSVGVSMFFHTYITPEAYELFVKEISCRYSLDINKTKTVYDIISCSIAVVLSFVFFGFMHFEGVKAGTIICALINGYTIGLCSKFFDKHLEFKDALNLRKYFS